MGNIELAKEMEKRTKTFSINIIRFLSSIPRSIEYDVIKNQLAKSATSIGANYREANRSRSKADFFNRLRICQAESSETLYWLEILKEILPSLSEIDSLINESKEFLAIFTAIISKLRQN